jgi:hypothetical protein
MRTRTSPRFALVAALLAACALVTVTATDYPTWVGSQDTGFDRFGMGPGAILQFYPNTIDIMAGDTIVYVFTSTMVIIALRTNDTSSLSAGCAALKP